MKKIILGFAMIVGLSQAVFSQLQVGLVLQGSSTPVLCEPIPVQLYWENKGAKPIKVGPPIDPKFSKALSLWVDGQKAMSFPPPDAPAGLISPLAPSDLGPGERIEKPYDLRVLKLRPGTHQVKVVADFVGFPEGYYQGRVESGALEITMRTPQGVDQQAYEFAVGMVDRGETNTPYMSRDEAICVGLETTEVLARYPSSIYAAWTVVDHFSKPDTSSPEKIFELMKKGTYIVKGGVPWPEWKSGWKELSGDEFAQWQIEWAERILQSHSDFAYANRLKLVMGLCYLKLNQEQKGIEQLSEVTKSTGTESQWAAKIVELWKASKPKP
jgi:hypothetical protein